MNQVEVPAHLTRFAHDPSSGSHGWVLARRGTWYCWYYGKSTQTAWGRVG